MGKVKEYVQFAFFVTSCVSWFPLMFLHNLSPTVILSISDSLHSCG
jgi:hypothetical protein